MNEKEIDLHLEDIPFGTMDLADRPEKSEQIDLTYVMAQQISILAQMILWIRCTTDISLKDITGKDIRKLSVIDLVGAFTKETKYHDFVKYDCGGKDPLDLSDYVDTLLNIYRQRQILKGIGNE